MSDQMTCDDAFNGLALAYWRMMDAIEKKVREETDGLPDFLAADLAAEVRRDCYPEEKKLWEDAYVRVMSAMARADIAAGYEPFTSVRIDKPSDAGDYAQGGLL